MNLQVGKKCRDDTNRAYNDCRNKVPSMFKWVCETVNVGEQSCSAFSISSGICAPLRLGGYVGVGIPTVINAFKNVVDIVKLSIKPKTKIDTGIDIDSGNLTEVVSEIRHGIENKWDKVMLVIKIVQALLTIPILLVPLLALKYLRKASQEREKGEQAFRKFLRKDVKKERANIVPSLFLILTHILLTLTVFGFDYLLHWSQNIVGEFGGSTVSVTGSLQFEIDVNAGVILQPFVNLFLQTISQERSYTLQKSSVVCLPNPVQSSGMRDMCFVGVLYVVILFSVVFQIIVVNLKEKIVSSYLLINEVEGQSTNMVGEEEYKKLNNLGVEQINKCVDGIEYSRVEGELKINVKELNKLNRSHNEGY